MSATHDVSTNGTTDGFLTWHWSTRLHVLDSMRADQRDALITKLRQLHDLPRERWEELEAYPMAEPIQTMYITPFTEDLYVYFTPKPDGTFYVEAFTTQASLDRDYEQLEQAVKP